MAEERADVFDQLQDAIQDAGSELMQALDELGISKEVHLQANVYSLLTTLQLLAIILSILAFLGTNDVCASV